MKKYKIKKFLEVSKEVWGITKAVSSSMSTAVISAEIPSLKKEWVIDYFAEKAKVVEESRKWGYVKYIATDDGMIKFDAGHFNAKGSKGVTSFESSDQMRAGSEVNDTQDYLRSQSSVIDENFDKILDWYIKINNLEVKPYEGKTYLLNSFSIQMLEDDSAEVSFIKMLGKPDMSMLTSAIGHQDTANVLGVQMNRENVTLKSGDIAYVAQLKGGRLKEGATTLPEGFKIEYFKIIVK